MRILLWLTMVSVFVMQEATSEKNDCGVTSFSASQGVVQSPNFPYSYPDDLRCRYSISVGSNNSVLLKFLRFELESGYGARCDEDWLTISCTETDDEVLDVMDSSRSKYCGSNLPRKSVHFSNCPVVFLTFVTDSSIGYSGFSIGYTILDNANFSSDDIIDLECGKTEFNNSSGVISLPQNPTELSARVNCDYTITINHAPFRLSISSFIFHHTQLLDSFSDCHREYINIGCTSAPNARYGRFCRQSIDDYDHYERDIFISNCRTVNISIRSSNYIYQEDYGISFSDEEDACGKTLFTGSTGHVTSPRFPLVYPHDLHCVYSIDVDRQKLVTLHFLSFTLEGTSHSPLQDECTYDWVTVSCFSDDSVLSNADDSNRRYCGNKTSEEPIKLSYSNCDSLKINFVSDSSVSRGGFQIQYTLISSDIPEEDCGNMSFTDRKGIISSPRFPLSYSNRLNCVYPIVLDRSMMVVLQFSSFNVEGVSHTTRLDSCNYDWLEINCSQNRSLSEDSHRSRKYCGAKETPLMLGYSKCDSLTLNFVTDFALARGGFQLKYTIISPGSDQLDCGDTLFSGPSGVVTSPRYPFAYPHNMNCTYSIDAGLNNSVLLKFKHFDLDKSNSMGHCTDYLMISCNETAKSNPITNKKYCGSIKWISSLRIVDCPSLLLEFVSSRSNDSRGGGFVIEYTLIKNSNNTEDDSELDCGTTLFTNSSGVISLPRNPRNYLATVNCTYTISANRSSYISLDTYLSTSMPLLQSFQDCETESITIGCVSERETALNSNTTIVFCRQERQGEFSSNYMYLLYNDCHTLKLSIRSTNYDNVETIRIPFSVIGADELCGTTTFSAPFGTISSQILRWQYGRSVNCLYTIDSGRLNSVVVIFDRLFFGPRELSHANETCSSGWVTISCLVNGTSAAHSHADRKLCVVDASTRIRFPECRSVLLNFSSSHISHNTGFSIRYRTGDYDPDCGNTSYSGPTGFITSPHFPLLYAHNLNCLYSITGGERTTISLSFLSFSLVGISSTPPSLDRCYSDWLTVGCFSDQSAIASASLTRRYCGHKAVPLKFKFPNCAVVLLNFRSDTSVSREGFKVRFRAIDIDAFCGVSVHNTPSGVISIPGNYTDYDESIDCSYTINASIPSSISLTIWSTSLQGSVERNCQSDDWLLISCINGETGLDHKVSHSSCNHLNSSSQLTLPSCTAATVVYHRDSEATGKTFRIEYKVTRQENIQTTATPVSSEIPPVTRSGKCELGCDISADGSTCDCPTTQSGVAVTNKQMNVSSHRGRTVVISLTVILLVTGAICVGAFLLLRRHRKKKRSEMLLQETEEDGVSVDGGASDISGSMSRVYRNEDRYTSRYVQLRPMSFGDREEQPTGINSA